MSKLNKRSSKKPAFFGSKKAQIGDLVAVIIVITGFAISMIIGYYVFVKVDSGLKETGMTTTESEQVFKVMDHLLQAK